MSSYELWISADPLAAAPTWAKVPAYSTNALTYVLSVGTTIGAGPATVAAGATYALRTLASNSVGSSAPSAELIAIVAGTLGTPA